MGESAWRTRAEEAEHETERLNARLERAREALMLPERIDSYCRSEAKYQAEHTTKRAGKTDDEHYGEWVECTRQLAAKCLHQHGEIGMGHPGCDYCPVVHGYRRVLVG